MVNKIPIAQPKLAGNEKRYVMDCLDSNWISSIGKYISLFEESFASFCGVKHAVAVNNGTSALHLALVALNLQPGDEVIVPTVTYIATANAVAYCGATPVLVDVLPGTLNIDPKDIEKKITSKTKGIIPVHLYGLPANMDEILAIARKHNLFVLEDAAEAHGATYKGKSVGSFGDCATFSFFGNKIITTGEGGMVTTNDDTLNDRLRLFRGQGMDKERRYWFPVIGYNYRMTNIQAAIGLAQLENVQPVLEHRQELARWYHEALNAYSNALELPLEYSGAKHVYWMYTIFLKQADEARRDRIISALDKLGIETRPVFYPLHIMPIFFNRGPFPAADAWAQRGISLPTHMDLTLEDVKHISDCIGQVLEEA